MVVLLLASCDKKAKGTFTIKGTLLKDCTGEPIAGRYIYATDFVKFGHGAQKIGETSTDINGNFELVCDYYDGEDPKQVKGLLGEYSTPRGMKSGTVIDLGRVYRRFETSVVVQLDVANNAVDVLNDTLLLIGSSLYQKVYPIPLGKTNILYSYEYDNSHGGLTYEESRTKSISYKLSSSHDSIARKYTDSYNIAICGLAQDTVVVTIR